MRWLWTPLLLVLVVACGSPNEADRADEHQTKPTRSTEAPTPASSAPPSATPSQAPTSASPTVASTTPAPEPKVSWALKLDEDSDCMYEQCVPRPSLAQTPKLQGNAAVLRSKGLWVSELVVPTELAASYITCKHNANSSNSYENWTFVAKSDKDFISEDSPDDEGAWFQLDVSRNGDSGYEAEALLAVSDGDIFTITDSTGNADNIKEPVLQWAWTPNKRSVRFSFRTASYPEYSYDRADGIGNVLVTGAVACL